MDDKKIKMDTYKNFEDDGLLLSLSQLQKYIGISRNKTNILFNSAGFPKVVIDGQEFAIKSEVNKWLIHNKNNHFYKRSA